MYSHALRLLYVTSGVLLKMLTHRGSFAGISHVVLDEFHERTLDVDLLTMLYGLVGHDPENASTKLVIMSATLELPILVRRERKIFPPVLFFLIHRR